MKGINIHCKELLIFKFLLFISVIAQAQQSNLPTNEITEYSLSENYKTIPGAFDSLFFSTPINHRIGIEIRPAYIMPTNPYIKDANKTSNQIKS